MTFSSTFRPESRLYSWNTNPTFSARMWARSRSPSFAVSTSSMNRLPAVGLSSSPSRSSIVVLPLPERPTTAMNSPLSMSSVTPPNPIAHTASDEADERRLDEELAHDVARRRANGFLEADLPHALGDRHEHGVDDREPADDQRQQRGRGGDGGEDRPAGLEAVHQVARFGRLHAGDLRVDLVGDFVQRGQRGARLAIDRDALGDLGHVERALQRDWQAIPQ